MKRPNILFLFADDQRFDTLGALGHPQIKTPNLDRLAARGTRFTHAHIPGGSSAAVCMPSRAMLHTGRSLFQIEREGQQIDAAHTTLGEHLQSNGYRTFGTGKWHNGRPAYARSFTDGAEIFFGGMTDHWNVPAFDFDPTGAYDAKCPMIEDPMHSKRIKERSGNHIIGGKHSSELLADAAINWLEDYDSAAPFFAYVAFLAPHDPRTMPQRFRDMYRDEEIELPPNFSIQHPFDLGTHQIRDEVLADYPRKPSQMREHIADYYGMITHLDHEIGRILDTLEATGHGDDTLIVFAADNGLAVGQHGLLGKQSLYEHSVRVPLIFAGPDIPEGQQRDAFCFLYDLFPTLCGLVDITPPETTQGESFSSVIRENKPGPRDELYLAYTQLHRAVRTRTHKLIECNIAGVRTTQLFDLVQDPYETQNLAGDPASKALLTDLRQRMQTHRDASGELDRPNGKQFWDTMEF